MNRRITSLATVLVAVALAAPAAAGADERDPLDPTPPVELDGPGIDIGPIIDTVTTVVTEPVAAKERKPTIVDAPMVPLTPIWIVPQAPIAGDLIRLTNPPQKLVDAVNDVLTTANKDHNKGNPPSKIVIGYRVVKVQQENGNWVLEVRIFKTEFTYPNTTFVVYYGDDRTTSITVQLPK
jgi:hypothetical protein